MKDRAFKETVAGILQKVFNGDRRFVRVKLHHNVTVCGVQCDRWVGQRQRADGEQNK